MYENKLRKRQRKKESSWLEQPKVRHYKINVKKKKTFEKEQPPPALNYYKASQANYRSLIISDSCVSE